jgi:O-antigen/teichoic acid export membrane protein
MIIKSTIFYAPAIIAPRAAAFILVLLLTRSLEPAEFGLYALVVLIGEMLDMGASNWIRLSMLRSDVSAPGHWRDGLSKSASLSLIFVGLACLIGLSVSFAIAPGYPFAFAGAVAAYVAANSSLRLGLSTLQLQGRRLEYSAFESVRAAGLLASGWLISTMFPHFWAVAVANAVVTATIASAVLLYSVRKLPKADGDGATYRSRVAYGLPIVALTFVSYMVASSDRLFLNLLSGAASVGVYAAAYSIARTPSDVVGNAINQGGFPELMRRHDSEGPAGSAEVVRNNFELMSLLQFTILGFSAGLSSAIVNFLLPPDFRSVAGTLMPVITAAAVCISLKAYVFDGIFHAVRKNWLQFWTYVPAGLATVVAAFLLIPPLGALGAALALLTGSFGGLVSSIALSRRFVKVSVNKRELAKAATLGITGGGVGHLIWMATPQTWPAFAILMIAGISGMAAWIAVGVLVRPRLFQAAFAALTKIGRRLAPQAG